MPGLQLRKNTFKKYLFPISHVCLSNADNSSSGQCQQYGVLTALQPDAEVEQPASVLRAALIPAIPVP